MSVLTLAGVPYDVRTEGAAENSPERFGGREGRTYDGTWRSTIKDEFRGYTYPLAPMTQTDYNILYNNTRLGVVISAGGDVLPATMSVTVKITQNEYIRDDAQALGYQRLVTVELIEV